DLMGINPEAKRSAFGLPRAEALYGPLPAQLKDPKSFASQLRRLLAARKEYRLAEAELLAVPEVKERAMCLLVLRLPGGSVAVTALNFGRDAAEQTLDLAEVRGITAKGVSGEKVLDILTAETVGRVSDEGHLKMKLAPLTGTSLIIKDRARGAESYNPRRCEPRCAVRAVSSSCRGPGIRIHQHLQSVFAE